MALHLEKAIAGLKERILSLGKSVEQSVIDALGAVSTKDALKAKRVIDGDVAIDLAEVEVEEECLKILALHQPVASDLRFIVAVLKINNDLERIGDLAVNIARRAESLAETPDSDGVSIDFMGGEEHIRQMLRESLDCLVNLDEELARKVWAADSKIDEINRSVHRQVAEAIRVNPSNTDRLLMLLSVSRNMERIGDHSTNIAEDVLYMINGEIVRHSQVNSR
jgi:phosphate transport system protein